jgi:hypothetical protein
MDLMRKSCEIVTLTEVRLWNDTPVTNELDVFSIVLYKDAWSITISYLTLTRCHVRPK